ncbi:MAG: hypothetical protein WAV95_17815 [Azonexus sp.]
MGKTLRVLCGLVWLLAGCERVEEAPSAASNAPAALMQLAFPGWKPAGPESVREIASPAVPGKSPEIGIYALAPGLLLKPVADRVVLVVVGVPADAQGTSQVGHASQAQLGAYWFEKRGERWFKVAEQPEFAQEGFSGNPGELRQVDLGGGKIALAVENGSCWQGSCGTWLGLYAVGEQQLTKIFGDLLSSDSVGAKDGCSELLKRGVGQQQRVALDEYSSNIGCYEIAGRWSIAPAVSGPGQLLIDFDGLQSSGEMVPALPSKAEGEGSEVTEEYLVTVSKVHQQQVYNHQNGRYVLAGGTNPNPGL